MSPAVIKKSYTATELREKRARLLAEIGLKRPSELAKIASKRMLTDTEEAIAYELESIAFLLGEESPRID